MKVLKKCVSVLLSIIMVTSLCFSAMSFVSAAETNEEVFLGASETFLFGDLNEDSKVDISDLSILSTIIAQNLTLSNVKQVIADVNGDNFVNQQDCNAISQFITSGTQLPIYSTLTSWGFCGKDDDDVRYMLKKDGVLTIFGQGEMADYTVGEYISMGSESIHSPWYGYKESSIDVIIKDGVTSIGTVAFSGMTISSIILPSSLTTISNYAFWYCKELSTIDILDNVNSIGYSCFGHCLDLQSINVSTGNSYYSSQLGILYDKNKTKLIVCPAGTNQTDIILPTTVQSLTSDSFANCESIQKITFSDALKEINEGVFDSCKIKEFEIGKNVTYIGRDAFQFCNDTEKYTVDSENQYYSNDSRGALFNKDKTKLIRYPSGDISNEYTVPNSVKYIGEDAFRSAVNLTSISLGNKVTDIDDNAFWNCINIDNIVLPSSLQKLHACVFAYCINLKKITIPSSVTYASGAGEFMNGSYQLTIYTESGSYFSTYPTAYDRHKTVTWDVLQTNVVNRNNIYYGGQAISYSFTPTTSGTYYFQSAGNYDTYGIIYDADGNQLATNDDGGVKSNFKIGYYLTSGTKYYLVTRLYNKSIDTASYDVVISNKEPYTITFDGNGGRLSSDDNAIVVSSNSLTPVEPTRDMYEFVGWNTSSSATSGTKTITPNSSSTYYAIWKKSITSLSDCTVTLSPTSFTYNGNNQYPTLSVKAGTTTLVNGTDYSVTYPSNSTNAGTYSLTITGKGNYTGSETKSYVIYPKSISNCTVTLGQTYYTYDGTEKTPTVTVKDGSKTLTMDTDYTLSYYSNTNAGTAMATVTITGKGNYTGSVNKYFTIYAKSISGCTVEVNPDPCSYDENGATPYVTVKDGEKTLSQNWDYTVTYSNNTSIGTATATITGKGNYSGTISKNFEIVKRSVADCSITLSQTTYTYDGTEKLPAIILKDGSKTLTFMEDFRLEMTDNVEAGTATVTIYGMGVYGGSTTRTFTISPKSISGMTVTLSKTSYTYDGTEKKPSVTVKDGSKTLTKDTEYTVTYSDNTNAGTATVTVAGKGNYSGSVEKSFTIDAKSITGCDVTLPSSCTYEGIAVEPYISVVDGTRSLSEDWDYTLSYTNNNGIGTATVTITGIGNYYGTITKEFEIVSKPIYSATITLSNTVYTYDGTEKKPSVTVKDGNKTLTKDTDYTLEYSNNKDAGTATVTVSGKGVYAESTTRTFTISPKSITGMTVTLSSTSYTYDGIAKQPTVTVKDGSKTLTKDTDYTVAYSGNTNAGQATVTVVGRNNYQESITKTFTISKKSISGAKVTISPSTCTYEGTAAEPYVTVEVGTRTLSLDWDYTVAYSNNNKVGTAKVTITGKDNYTGTIEENFEIVPKSIYSTVITLSATTYTYDGKEKKPAVTVKDGTKTLTKDKDYKVTYSNNTRVGTATVEIEGIGDYKDKTSRTFTINPKSTSGITVTLSQTEYTYDGSEKKPGVTVKNGTTTLKKDTDYSLYYSDNINVGTAKVTVNLQGNYTGTVTENFTITPDSITDAQVTLSPSSYIYDGTDVKPFVTVKKGMRMLLSDIDYTVTYSNNKNAGKATVTIVGKDNYTGTLKETFTISPKSIILTDITLSETDFGYDGTEKKPVVTVKDGTKTLTENTDYTVSYKDNVSSGTATATITGKGNYTGKTEKNFTITAPAFIWGEDNWSFNNTGQYFTNHNVNKTILNLLTKDFNLNRTDYSELTKGMDRLNRLDAENGFIGSCFGMTVSEILVKQGDLDLSKYGGNSVVTRNSNTEEIISLINFVQCMQDVGRTGQILRQTSFMSANATQSSYIDTLNSSLQYSNKLLHISLLFTDVDKRSGKTTSSRHAVLGYGVENCNYYSSVTNKNYDRRILIADPNCLSDNELNEKACIYYQSSTNSWICPYYCNEDSRYRETCYWNSSSGKDTSNGAIVSILEYLSLKDTSSPMFSSTDHYIAGLSVKTDGTSQSSVIQEKSTGNPDYDFAGGSGFGIAKYTGDYAGETDEKEERYALWNQTANYTLSYGSPEDFDLSMDYENIAYFAEIENGTYMRFKPSGSITMRGSNASYSISMVTNDGYCVTDWYDITVSGKKADNFELEKTRNGYILTSADLENVTITAQNDDVIASRTFSTDNESVFVYEINKNTIGIKIDTDGDGTYETELPIEHDELLGDVDSDGEIEIRDATWIQRRVAKMELPFTFKDEVADVDGDGQVTLMDATTLQRYLSHLKVNGNIGKTIS